MTALGWSAAFSACRWLVASKMGLVLTAMRDQEQRLRFLGYPVAHYKIFIFAVAAALAGLAGALYVPQVGIITPSQIGVLPSLEVVVWVATGGRGTLIGALLGAVGVNAARSLLTATYPEWWPIILGGLFVGVVSCFQTVLWYPQAATTAPTPDPHAALRALGVRFCSLSLRERVRVSGWREASAAHALLRHFGAGERTVYT